MGQELPAPAAGAHDIEQLLLGLADGSYVLSTPDGHVAECGASVVALLGAPAENLAGRRTADVVLEGADAATHAAFERVLHGEAPGADQTFRTTTAAGVARALHVVVIAVPLALGWEFTSLLGELGSRDTGTWHPEALRLRHGRALEAIQGVCDTGIQPEPGARLAGILVVVRDADAPPLTRADVARRMAEQREAARAAAAEKARRANAWADALEGDGGGLEDLVEAARVLRERVEEAERESATAIADRDHALAQLAAAQAERAELQDARGESAALQERITALGGELEAARHELEVARGEHLAGAVAERDGLREELERTQAQLRVQGGELDSTRSQLQTLRAELDSTRSQLQTLRAELEHAREELATTSAAADGARAELERTREEFATTQAAAEGARAERERERARAEELLSAAEAARAAADAIRAEFAFDAPPAAVRPANGSAPQAPAAETLALPPAAPGEALALIGLDGTFKRLDAAFCSLLGHRESELRSARWPSVIDRENLAAHTEVARALRAGEIGSAQVETVYMHAHGLLIPIAGTVSMHRADPSGPATHYLFRAEVRRTSGG